MADIDVLEEELRIASSILEWEMGDIWDRHQRDRRAQLDAGQHRRRRWNHQQEEDRKEEELELLVGLRVYNQMSNPESVL